MSNESLKMLMSVVTERHKQYKSRLDGMLDTLSNNDQAKKLEACNALNESAVNLSNVLAAQDRPSWLETTINATDEFSRKNKKPSSIASGSSWALLQKLMGLRQHAMAHSWEFDQANSTAYDFDAVFEQIRSTSSMIELFDTLIATLEEMLATDQIDSSRAIDALNKLLSTISQNKTGSYFSTIASWKFAHSFVKNAIWATLDEVPVIKPMKAAFEKTLKEMDLEVDALHNNIKIELKQKFDIVPTNALTNESNPLAQLEDLEPKE